MTKHLTEQQQIDYIYRTLTDDQRAAIDHHLAGCPACRAQLAEEQALEHRIRYRIIAQRNEVAPQFQPAYAAIGSRVKRPSRAARVREQLIRFSSGVAAVAALLVLVILLIGAFGGARQATVNPLITPTPAATPTTPAAPKLVWKIEATPGGLSAARNLTLDREGNLYVLDIEDRVLKYDRDGQFLTQWGSTGRGDGQIFNNGWGEGIASDSLGNIYVVDQGNFRIQKFDNTGKFLLKWGEQGDGPGQFKSPWMVAVDSQDNVYVLDGDQNRVQKFDSHGKFLLQWGKENYSSGQTFNVSSLTIDNHDFVYLMDNSYGTIQIFDRDGKFTARWTLKCGDDQPIRPLDLTTDSSGHVYITDFYSNRVCKYDSNGQFLHSWGTTGTADDQFNSPEGIAVDAQGDVYVADYNNQRVLKVSQP
jgi:DNA-binding beta-propeller fold protein YncE